MPAVLAVSVVIDAAGPALGAAARRRRVRGWRGSRWLCRSGRGGLGGRGWPAPVGSRPVVVGRAGADHQGGLVDVGQRIEGGRLPRVGRRHLRVHGGPAPVPRGGGRRRHRLARAGSAPPAMGRTVGVSAGNAGPGAPCPPVSSAPPPPGRYAAPATARPGRLLRDRRPGRRGARRARGLRAGLRYGTGLASAARRPPRGAPAARRCRYTGSGRRPARPTPRARRPERRRRASPGLPVACIRGRSRARARRRGRRGARVRAARGTGPAAAPWPRPSPAPAGAG